MGRGVVAAGSATIDLDSVLTTAERAVRNDTAQCEELIALAESRIAGHRDPARAARLSELRGELGLVTGDLIAAGAAYRASRRHWLAAGRRPDAIRATLGRNEVQLLLGEFEDVLATADRVQECLGQELWEDEPRLPWLNAVAQRQLAAARAGLGDVTGAMRAYCSAENQLYAIGDLGELGTVNLRRGLLLLDLGMPHAALAELRRARTEFRRAGWARAAVYAVVQIADAMSATGQVSRSLELLDRIRPELVDSKPCLAFHDLSRAKAVLRAGMPAEAHAEAQAAAEVFFDNGMVEFAARAESVCADASMCLGRTDVAAVEVAAAERLSAECGNRLLRARAWLAQARLAMKIDDPQTARALCRRALAADIDEMAPYLGVWARLIAAGAEDPEAADALLDGAAALATQDGSPELRVDVLLGRARCHRRTGDNETARDELRRALDVGRAWRHGPVEHPSGGLVRAALAEATDELIQVLIDMDDHASRVEAWQRAHAAKTGALVPLAERARGWVPDATEELRQVRLEVLLDGADEPNDWAPPLLRTDSLPPVPTSSFVEYYVVGDDVIAFVVRDGQVEVRVLRAIASETRRLVIAWQQECLLMSTGPARHLRATATSSALDELRELLLSPLTGLLADLDDDLHVLGHRHLHSVPFDALLEGARPVRSQLADLDRAPKGVKAGHRAAVEALVLAVPDAKAPSITAEAEMIFRTMPSAEILLGDQATRGRLAELAPHADIVHFACHGVFRPENPLFSAIRLGDGWLSARDILGGSLGLDGSVVVLSACASGRSPDHVAEPIGLAWACLVAGARGVVAALWPVDDAVTLTLMTLMYQGLSKGVDPVTALREARRTVARRHPHPYYWAAFSYMSLPDQLITSG